jgi:hypothetical protein
VRSTSLGEIQDYTVIICIAFVSFCIMLGACEIAQSTGYIFDTLGMAIIFTLIAIVLIGIAVLLGYLNTSDNEIDSTKS